MVSSDASRAPGRMESVLFRLRVISRSLRSQTDRSGEAKTALPGAAAKEPKLSTPGRFPDLSSPWRNGAGSSHLTQARAHDGRGCDGDERTEQGSVFTVLAALISGT